MMNLSDCLFQREVILSALLTASTDSGRDLGTDVKMSFLMCVSAGTGVTGPAGKWSWRTGRRCPELLGWLQLWRKGWILLHL